MATKNGIDPNRKCPISPASELVPISELRLGDVVRIIDVFGDATVARIENEGKPEAVAHIFRPCIHIGDFSYTGGVLHYIGIRRGPELK